MARRSGVNIKTTIYSQFRGADFSTDPSMVDKARSPLCTNIIADEGGMPEKRPGWRVLQEFGGAVYGIFAGVFQGTAHRLCHAGNSLYSWEESGEPQKLLSELPEHKSRGVSLGGKLWIVTGGLYIVYDGESAQAVTEAAPYVPTTVITRMPEGGGESYEDVNMLTPYRKNAFQTDGEATEFLLDGEVDDSGQVRVWVWDQELLTGWSVDRGAGKITFDTPPAAPDAGSEDGLVVEFPHTVEGYAAMINGCSIITSYGVGTNDRLILSGNPDYPNRDWTSALNDPTYFPDLLYNTVGTEGVAIRGYCRLGSYLAVVKADNGQDSTVFLRSAGLDEEGNVVFAQQQAIAGVGAISQGSFASLLDDPLFLSGTGVYALATNTITSEKVTQNRSYFLNARLIRENGLGEAEAVIWRGMYLLAVGAGHVYILDARQKKSYRSAALGDYVYEGYYWENVPARCWLAWMVQDQELLYFGTEDGRLCQFNSDMDTVTRFSDGGEAISAVWATKYDDDGTPSYYKTVLKRGCCVTIKPYARSSGTVYFRSDRSAGLEQLVASDLMDIFDWEDIDFERFTFASDDSPQEIFFSRKVKNYKRLQIIIRNSQLNEGFGVYQITKHYVVGNFAKAYNAGQGAGSAGLAFASDEEVREVFEEAAEEVLGEEGT